MSQAPQFVGGNQVVNGPFGVHWRGLSIDSMILDECQATDLAPAAQVQGKEGSHEFIFGRADTDTRSVLVTNPPLDFLEGGS
jgi:hypothetical protein